MKLKKNFILIFKLELSPQNFHYDVLKTQSLILGRGLIFGGEEISIPETRPIRKSYIHNAWSFSDQKLDIFLVLNYKPVFPYVQDSIQSSKLTSLVCKWVGHNDFPKLYPFQPIWPNLVKLYQDYAKSHHYNPDHREQSKQCQVSFWQLQNLKIETKKCILCIDKNSIIVCVLK